MAIEVRKINGEGDDGKLRFGNAFFHESRPDQSVPLIVGEGVGQRRASVRIGVLAPGQFGIGIGDPHDQVAALRFPGQQIGHVVGVEHLTPAVDNAGFIGRASGRRGFFHPYPSKRKCS